MTKSLRQRHERHALLLWNFSGVFSCQEQRKLKETRKLHKLPNGLGRLKPPPEQVRGDSKLDSPSDKETLASTGTTQGGTNLSSPKRAKRGCKDREEGGREDFLKKTFWKEEKN
jgi:hypothetical protein